ncbi:MAG TPA: LON peptidase substrate-binding domain-containing protein [Acidimicrobiales bacterium]|nr:LON peptidase substrate-binding domain-containing protein [Acidimicrobiales bacterium]
MSGTDSAGAAAGPLPMFPLGTVVFPGSRIPLHVFEDRFRALVRDCLEGSGAFGVVLIERGSEVGGGDARFDVGTVTRIAEDRRLPDGRFLLVGVGTHRLRVERWLAEDPYPRALVAPVADPAPSTEDRAAQDRAERQVRRALTLAAELGEGPPRGAAIPPDAGWDGWQLCAMAPVGELDRQRLLEQPGLGPRMALLEALATDAADLLADRLAGG